MIWNVLIVCNKSKTAKRMIKYFKIKFYITAFEKDYILSRILLIKSFIELFIPFDQSNHFFKSMRNIVVLSNTCLSLWKYFLKALAQVYCKGRGVFCSLAWDCVGCKYLYSVEKYSVENTIVSFNVLTFLQISAFFSCQNITFRVILCEICLYVSGSIFWFL